MASRLSGDHPTAGCNADAPIIRTDARFGPAPLTGTLPGVNVVARSATAAALAPLLARLEAEPNSACVLGEGGEILAVNAAWDRFAAENGGAPGCIGATVIGKTYFNFIDGGPPRAYFEGAWLRVLAGRAVTVRSECSSAEVVRQLSSLFLPVRIAGVPGAAVIHSVLRVDPVGTPAEPLRLATYLRVDGRVLACTSCRRVQRADGSAWDLHPGLIDAPPPADFAFCPSCLELIASGGRGGDP